MADPADSNAAPAVAPKIDTPALRNVRTDLGDALADKYVEARKIVAQHVDDVDKLTPATAIYVDILQSVPQDKTASAGYAEVLLAYGQALLSFARHSVAQVAILGGDVETAALEANLKESLRAKEGAPAKKADPKKRDVGRLLLEKAKANAETNGAGEPKKGDEKEAAEEKPAEEKPSEEVKPSEEKDEIKPAEKEEKQTNGEAQNGKEDEIDTIEEDGKGEGEGEEEVDDEVLTWEQLEYARRVFEDLGPSQRQRLADVYESLGDLLLETDQMKAAAVDYGKAIGILREAEKPRIRIISLLHYQRYLALRRDEPAEAVTALTESVQSFEQYVEETKKGQVDGKVEPAEKLEEVLKQMREELVSFKEALPKEEKAENGKSGGDDDEISVVQPRKKQSNNEEEVVTVVQPRRRTRKVMEVDEESADGKDEPAAKKARVEEGEGEKGAVSQKMEEEGKKDLKEVVNGQEEKK